MVGPRTRKKNWRLFFGKMFGRVLSGFRGIFKGGVSYREKRRKGKSFCQNIFLCETEPRRFVALVVSSSSFFRLWKESGKKSSSNGLFGLECYLSRNFNSGLDSPHSALFLSKSWFSRQHSYCGLTGLLFKSQRDIFHFLAGCIFHFLAGWNMAHKIVEHNNYGKNILHQFFFKAPFLWTVSWNYS